MNDNRVSIFKNLMDKWATDPELATEATHICDILAQSKDRDEVLMLVSRAYCMTCGRETYGVFCECGKDGWC